MTDFANNPAYQKGRIGEEIVKKILEKRGALVTRPDDSGRSLVDFHAVPGRQSSFAERYIEVKVRTAMPYAYGQYLCYSAPVVQIEAYKKFAAEKNLPVELWIVDPEEGKIFIGNSDLQNKIWIDGKEFPFDQKTKRGLMRFYHQRQFSEVCDLKPADLAHLNAIKISNHTANFPKELADFFQENFHAVPIHAAAELKTLQDECGTEKLLAAIPLGAEFKSVVRSLSRSDKPDMTKALFLNAIRQELEAISRLDENQTIAFKYLGIKLPVDLPEDTEAIAALAKKLAQKLENIPSVFLYELDGAIGEINRKLHFEDFYGAPTRAMRKFYEEFCPQIYNLREARFKIAPPSPVTELNEPAEKISTHQTPNGTYLDLFAVGGKLFVKAGQLSMAVGYKSERAGNMDNSTLGKAIRAVGKRYKILFDKKNSRFVATEDVASILHDYAFKRVYNSADYETAQTLSAWWTENLPTIRQVTPPKIQSSVVKVPVLSAPDIEDIKNRADLLAKAFDLPKKAALRAAIKLKAQELGRDLTPLLEVLGG